MSYEVFRNRPAKRGFGAERKRLMEELRCTTTCVFHQTIMCSGQNPPEEWVARLKEFKDEAVELEQRLDKICGPEKEDKRFLK